jgi:hypothetical protein
MQKGEVHISQMLLYSALLLLYKALKAALLLLYSASKPSSYYYESSTAKNIAHVKRMLSLRSQAFPLTLCVIPADSEALDSCKGGVRCWRLP